MNGFPKLLTPREAADMMRVHVRTLERWHKEGKLPALVLPSGQRRYYESDLQNLLEGKTGDD